MDETSFLICSHTASMFLIRLTSASRNVNSPLGLIDWRFCNSDSNLLQLRPTIMALGWGMCLANARRVARPMPAVAPANTAVRESCFFRREAFADLTSDMATMFPFYQLQFLIDWSFGGAALLVMIARSIC